MISLAMPNGRTVPLADNAFARWLAERVDAMGIGRGTYRPLETALARRGLKVSAGSIWDYMHSGKLPTRAVADRFAAFFGWDPDEVWRIRVRAQREQDDALLGDPSGLPTASAVRGIQNADETPAAPPAMRRPAVLFYGPHGEIDGAEGLTDEEAASVAAAIAIFRARRAPREGGGDAGDRRAGAGGAL